MPTHSLQARFEAINEKIRQAAERSGRSASDVRLVAVTKKVAAGLINEAIELGIRDLAESRVQEAQAKRPSLVTVPELKHHFIGGLQTNKARKAIEFFDVIQSVDRPELAATLDRIAAETGKTLSCLVEVKVSSEPSKSGVPFSSAEAFLREFERYPHLTLTGLMTIAPYDAGEAETRRCFKQLAGLFRAHRDQFGESPTLSMGMSDDFELAIEEGSTMVRIGRALFGERQSLVPGA